MRVLNKKETRKTLELIGKQFKTSINTDCYISKTENKFYLISKDLEKVDLGGLRVVSAGLYFGKLEQGIFIPSKESVQMFDLPV